MKIVILIGLPGSGKGTCAKYICDNFDYQLLSLGDILRSESKNDSVYGREIRSKIDNGLLVTDEIISKLMEKKISSLIDDSILLDGFPRNVAQAEILDRIIIKLSVKIDSFKVIYLNLPINLAKERLSKRIICNFCGAIYNSDMDLNDFCIQCKEVDYISKRVDDSDDGVVKNRLDLAIKNNGTLLDYYKDCYSFYDVDGGLKVDLIQKILYDLLK